MTFLILHKYFVMVTRHESEVNLSSGRKCRIYIVHAEEKNWESLFLHIRNSYLIYLMRAYMYILNVTNKFTNVKREFGREEKGVFKIGSTLQKV